MDLTPTTGELGDLLVRMTQEPWPTTETERHGYFDRLGLRDLGPFEAHRDDHDTSRGRFATSLPGAVDGTYTVFRGELLGLSVFAYTERIANSPRARAGYAGIQESLGHAIGRPVEQWGPATEPACLWRPGLLLLEMYCFSVTSAASWSALRMRSDRPSTTPPTAPNRDLARRVLRVDVRRRGRTARPTPP